MMDRRISLETKPPSSSKPPLWRYIEVWDASNKPAGFSFTEGTLNEDDLLCWAKKAAQRKREPNLRVLFCPPFEDEMSVAAIGMKPHILEDIVRVWRLPALVFLADSREMSVAYTTDSAAADSAVSGLLLRNNNGGHWFYCLAMSYDAPNHETCAVLSGLNDKAIESIKDWLKSWPRYNLKPTNPLLLPTLLIEDSLLRVSKSFHQHNGELWDVEQDTGLHFRNTEGDYYSHTTEDMNLDTIIRKLTALPGGIAHVEFVCKTQLQFLETLISWSSCALHSHKTADSESLMSWGAVIEQVKLLRSSFVYFLTASDYCHKRMHAQTQTIYNLLGQRDNRLNRFISENQRRDSLDMRIIAVVTLVFLPGTFTATLFSTTFFNFQATQKSNILSKWIWLYGVFTITLTFIVLATWLYWTRAHKQRVKK